MKRLLFYFIALFFCYSCVDEWQEEPERPATAERELWEWSREELMSIDEKLYDRFCSDTAFLSLCERHHSLMNKINSGDSIAPGTLAGMISAMKALGEEKGCKNIAVYVLKYEQERPATRYVDYGTLAEVKVTTLDPLYGIWHAMWQFYDEWKSLPLLEGVDKYYLWSDLSRFLTRSPYYGWVKINTYEKIIFDYMESWMSPLVDLRKFIKNEIRFDETWNYVRVFEDMYYVDIQPYFYGEMWRGLRSYYMPTPSLPPPPGPKDVAPLATGLFKNDELSNEQWKKLEEMIKKIMSDCMGGTLYNELVNKRAGNPIKLVYNSNMGGGGYFDCVAMELGIGSFESNVLFHEMVHAYQHAQVGTFTFGYSPMNMEIEARYAQYMYLSKLPEYKTENSKWAEWYTTPEGEAIKKLSRYIDAKGRLIAGESAEELQDHIRRTVQVIRDTESTDPREPHPYGDARYNTTLIGLDNFKSFINISKNCNP